MLIRSMWLFTVTETVLLPRAFNLALVRELHTKMQLNMGDAAIPNITCSGLIGKSKTVEDFVALEPDIPYQLILCGLNTPAVEAIKDLDLTDPLELFGAKFQVQRQPDEITSYEQLYHNSIVLEPPVDHRHTLNFLTPTAFSQKRKYLPLPLPNLMFHSWLERWNHFAPVFLGSDELIAYLDNMTAISQLRIQSRIVTIHKGQIPGFTGIVNLRLLCTDPLLMNIASLLLQYARFAGTGTKTRLGMGATDRLNLSNDSL